MFGRYFGNHYFGDSYWGPDEGGAGDDFELPFRDANYRRRFGGLWAIALLLLAGCIQPPRRAVYDPPCLRPDYGQVARPCQSSR